MTQVVHTSADAFFRMMRGIVIGIFQYDLAERFGKSAHVIFQ